MMDQPEKRTITVVKRLHVKNQLKDKAANLLTSTFRNLLLYIILFEYFKH